MYLEYIQTGDSSLLHMPCVYPLLFYDEPLIVPMTHQKLTPGMCAPAANGSYPLFLCQVPIHIQ